MDQSQQEMIAAAEMGEQARLFLESELGRCLIGLAQQDAEKAALELRTVDANDPKAIRDIQARVWRAESFEAYLRELVADGDNALQVFRQQHQE